MSEPLFSILIANYNNGHFLEESLESIYKQTYKNWEIIIVDDCSTDNSLAIYKKIENNLKTKIFYNQENKGAGYAKRRCIEEATGEICGFLDPDDTLAPEALEEMVSLHIKNPKCSMIHSKKYFCDDKLNVQSVYTHAKNVESEQPLFFNLNGEITHFTTFKKIFYNKTTGIDPYFKRAVDQDLYLKLYDAGETLFFDKALYYHRIHKSGISTNANARKAYLWHWIAILDTAKRRNINMEDLFFEYFIPKEQYDYVEEEYKKLAKYRKINKLFSKIRNLVKHK